MYCAMPRRGGRRCWPRAGVTLCSRPRVSRVTTAPASRAASSASPTRRSEEHTSELQSLRHLVCRLLLEKKKITRQDNVTGEPRARHTMHQNGIRQISGALDAADANCPGREPHLTVECLRRNEHSRHLP